MFTEKEVEHIRALCTNVITQIEKTSECNTVDSETAKNLVKLMQFDDNSSISDAVDCVHTAVMYMIDKGQCKKNDMIYQASNDLSDVIDKINSAPRLGF